MMKKGFSLIELLIVIAIMAILGSLALSAFSTARKQGRDTARKGDLAQYKVALEQYYAANGSYPESISDPDNTENAGDDTVFSSDPSAPLSSYFGNNPPRGMSIPNKKYYYRSDGLIYYIQADLEVGACWEVCSNGRSGILSSACSSNISLACHIP